MSFQCSVGSTVGYLKRIVKDDQGIFVVVTDTDMQYDPFSYFPEILSLEVFTVVMPFPAALSEGVVLLLSC